MKTSLQKAAAGVAPLLIIYVLFGFAQASNEFRILLLKSQGLTAADCGKIMAVACLLGAVSRLLSGALADKLRSRRAVYIGALVLWLAILVCLLAAQHVRIAGFVLCAGILPLQSISEPVTYGMIEAGGVQATLTHPKLDFSLIRVCLSIGYSVINFLYTPIVARFGPSAPFYCTVFYVVLLLALSGTMRSYETVPEKSGSAVSGSKLQLGRLFQNYFLMCFVLLSILYALGAHTQSYMVYLLEAVELDDSLVGVISGIRVLGEIITMPLIPMIKRKVSLPMLQAVAGGFVVVQIVLYLTCHNPYVVLGAALLNGISCGITLSTTAVYLREMAPAGLDTTTLSLSTAMTSFGQIVINLSGGFIVDSLGIFTFYRFTLYALILWFVLYFGTWVYGIRVLKKQPSVPMLLPKN